MTPRPFSEACERNKGPLLEVLERVLADRTRVLEIASGTGQHAVHFGAALPHLIWQTTELPSQHEGIQAWIDASGLDNVGPPLSLDVCEPDWAFSGFDAIFNANTVHIISWAGVESMFAGIGRSLPSGGVLVLYGPFNYGGRFTSESNARFDDWLKARDPDSGIRDFEAVDLLAQRQGLTLVDDVAMPANNRTLVWVRN